jgi:isoquinoline 1-oxidoreductase beta subunit
MPLKKPENKVAQMDNSSSFLSRREFLQKSSGTSIAVAGLCLVPACGVDNDDLSASGDWVEKEVSVWVRIQSDGRVIIYSPAAEMGQGSMTSVPLILAEEMDADWNLVKILQSPVDAEVYGMPWSPGGRKHMTTAGSRSVRHYYSLMRETGARIRAALCLNAAEHWGVDYAEVTAREGRVLHEKSGRNLSFGEVASFGSFDVLPSLEVVALKQAKDFNLIGRSMPRRDVPEKTNGKARYAMDVQLPGMLYGFMQRSPAHGASPIRSNASELLSEPGIHSIVNLDHGVGVLAESVERGLAVKERLQIDWSSTLSDRHDSQLDMLHYTPEGAEILKAEGDFDREFRTAAKTFEASATNAYACHAQMEPLNAVVRVAADKQSAEVWVGSQAPDRAQRFVAEALGLAVDKVTMNLLYLGGGFGRRSIADYVVEAAQLAAHVPGTAVKLIWTREDDFAYGAFRPQVRNFLRAAVDDKGRIVAWENTAVGPGGNMSSRGAGMDHYTIPNVQLMRKEIDHGVRLKHFRSVGHGTIKFAVETFIDQIARQLNRNPYQYRLDMMANERARRVLQRAAEISRFDPQPKNGRAMGIAFADRDAYTCGVAEVSLNQNTGQLRVHKYWCVCDAGIVVQPDNARRQIESSVLMGISLALKERIDIKAGKVQQSNYHDYPILRMSEMPESIEVELLESEGHIHGLGETGLPATGGAIASAFAGLTGKYLYDMPFTPDRVLAALASS